MTGVQCMQNHVMMQQHYVILYLLYLIFNSTFLAASMCIQHQTTVIKTKGGPTYDMIDEQLS